MALERQDIEKRDFPIGRRGYDPEAVDAHLSALADEVEQLKLASRQRSETVSSAASEQVRAILEAAEDSAADIQHVAEEEAREIRAQAAADAQATRERATAQARDYVGRVSESTAVMLQRLDAMESELGAMLESLRSGGQRLRSDLGLLDINLVDVSDAVNVHPRFEPESAATVTAPATRAADGVGGSPVEAVQETSQESDGATNGAQASESVSAEPDYSGTGQASDDEDARLIALNMALNGTPRDETERYLADNFELSDRASLLDEVYASVES